MTRPFVAPPAIALADWLAHVVAGLSLAAIAADRREHKSTILRRVRRVEALDDCPAWSIALDLLTAAEKARPGELSRAGSLAPACVALCRLGPIAIRGTLRDLGRLVPPDAAVIGVAANLPDAMIAAPSTPGVPPMARPRGLVLAWLLLGLVESRPHARDGIARLVATREGARIMRDDRAVPPMARLDRLLRTGAIPPDLERFARALVYDLEAAPAATESRLRTALPAQSVDLVCAMLRDGRPVEVIERAAGMPARSAKQALAMSLAALAQAETATSAPT